MSDVDLEDTLMDRFADSQKLENTRVIFLWGVDCLNNLLVPIKDNFGIHLG